MSTLVIINQIVHSPSPSTCYTGDGNMIHGPCHSITGNYNRVVGDVAQLNGHYNTVQGSVGCIQGSYNTVQWYDMALDGTYNTRLLSSKTIPLPPPPIEIPIEQVLPILSLTHLHDLFYTDRDGSIYVRHHHQPTLFVSFPLRGKVVKRLEEQGDRDVLEMEREEEEEEDKKAEDVIPPLAMALHQHEIDYADDVVVEPPPNTDSDQAIARVIQQQEESSVQQRNSIQGRGRGRGRGVRGRRNSPSSSSSSSSSSSDSSDSSSSSESEDEVVEVVARRSRPRVAARRGRGGGGGRRVGQRVSLSDSGDDDDDDDEEPSFRPPKATFPPFVDTKAPEGGDEDSICILCAVNKVALQYFPCQHHYACHECFKKEVHTARTTGGRSFMRCANCRARVIRARRYV